MPKKPAFYSRLFSFQERPTWGFCLKKGDFFQKQSNEFKRAAPMESEVSSGDERRAEAEDKGDASARGRIQENR